MKEAEVLSLTKRQEVLTKVLELYRVLMDQMVMSQVQTIETIVSEGLKTIFHDQDLSFKAEVGTSRGKISVDFFLVKGDPEHGGFKGTPLDSFGGGPSSIASLILRILTLLRLKRNPLLLLDETLSAVSDDYIEATGQFLQKLTASSGINILLVTHKAAFLDHSNVAFQGDSDGSKFEVRRLRG